MSNIDMDVAYSYAKAIYQISKRIDEVSYWLNVLDRLAKFANNIQFKTLLLNPKISNDVIVQLIMDYLNTKEDMKLNVFLKLIAENNRFALLDEIFIQFSKIYQNNEGVSEAIMESAYPVSDGDKNYFEVKLSKKFNKKIRLITRINLNLIGGIRIIIDDIIIDSSILGSLKKMATQLLR